jgi:class 3 adenylate cyclase
MPRLQAKTFDDSSDERAFPKGHAQLVTLGETTVGLARWEPGWQWSTHLKPLVGTASCPVHHLGYAMAGHMRFETDDGQVLEVGPRSLYEVPAGHDARVLGDEPFVTLEWTSARVVGVGPEAGQRVLATVLFSDIVDSTSTLARIGDEAWRGVLVEHNRRLRDAFNAYRGREIDTTGDGFLVVFDSASRAVHCGVAMTRAVHEMGIAIRVGVHTGEVEFVGDNARGVAVHTAARVMATADPDDVIISGTTRDLLEGSGMRFEEAGAHELKGLSGARTLYRVVADVGPDPASGGG